MDLYFLESLAGTGTVGTGTVATLEAGAVFVADQMTVGDDGSRTRVEWDVGFVWAGVAPGDDLVALPSQQKLDTAGTVPCLAAKRILDWHVVDVDDGFWVLLGRLLRSILSLAVVVDTEAEGCAVDFDRAFLVVNPNRFLGGWRTHSDAWWIAHRRVT